MADSVEQDTDEANESKEDCYDKTEQDVQCRGVMIHIWKKELEEVQTTKNTKSQRSELEESQAKEMST